MVLAAWSQRQWIALVIGLAAVLAVGSYVAFLAGHRPGWALEVTRTTEPPYEPTQFSDPLPPLTEPPTRPVREAWNALRPEEMVLGVTIGSASRAYPLNAFNEDVSREVVNDTLDGRPIVVTFCSLCVSGVVYTRDVGDRRLTFSPSGLLWGRSMILYDRETESYWSQMTGLAKRGPLEGQRLRALPSVITDWQSWRDTYPGGSVVTLAYHSEAFSEGLNRKPEDFVLGIASSANAQAWEFEKLAQTPVLNDDWTGAPVVVVYDARHHAARLYERSIGERLLTFRLQDDQLRDEQTDSTWNGLTGECTSGPLAGQKLVPLPTMVALRKAWRTFYPPVGR